MKYIIFSEFNRNHLLFLSLLIISIIKDVIKDSNKKLTKDMISSFVKYYSYNLFDLLAIIPVVIIAIRSRNMKSDESEQSNKLIINQDQNVLNKIINKNKKMKIFKIFRLHLIIAVFDFVGKYANVIYNIIITKKFFTVKKINLNTMYTINIIAICLLSVLILH